MVSHILQYKAGTGPGVDGGEISTSEITNLKIRGIVSDSSDNVYMAAQGNLTNYSNKTGMITFKLDPNNNTVWAKALYGSSTAYVEGPAAVGIDGSGNVYTIGYGFATGGFGGADAILVKYDNSGNFQWQRGLGGTGDDRGFGIAVSSAGNVYITGYSKTPTLIGSQDMFVAKYNTSGVLQWDVRIGGLFVTDGQSCTLDDSENVYIVGSSFEPNTQAKHTMVKLNSSGAHQWDRQWGRDGSGGLANDVAIDGDGNPLVVGSNSHGITISQFNASGTIQWQKTLDQTGLTQQGWGVAIDHNNKAYIVGAHQRAVGQSYNLVIASYSGGSLQWQRQIKSNLGTLYGYCIVSSQVKDKIYLAGEGQPYGYAGSAYFKLSDSGSGLGSHGSIDYEDSLLLDTPRDTIAYPVYNDNLTVQGPGSPGSGFSEHAGTLLGPVSITDLTIDAL